VYILHNIWQFASNGCRSCFTFLYQARMSRFLSLQYFTCLSCAFSRRNLFLFFPRIMLLCWISLRLLLQYFMHMNFELGIYCNCVNFVRMIILTDVFSTVAFLTVPLSELCDAMSSYIPESRIFLLITAGIRIQYFVNIFCFMRCM